MPMQETEPLTNSTRLNQSIRGWIQKAIDSLARIPFRTLVLGVILMISADFIHRNIVQFKETSDEALCAPAGTIKRPLRSNHLQIDNTLTK